MDMTEAAVLGLFEQCSNAGRWGPNDELGTLNYITPRKRLEALATVRTGVVLSIGKDLVVGGGRQIPPSAVHVMTYGGSAAISAQDLVVLIPHGFEITHMDAIAHSYFKDHVYNGRRAADVVTASGITFGSIMAAKDGILTRGILLDIPRSRGTEFLQPGEGISVDDMEAAEALAEVSVTTGDAVFVRSGLDLREQVLGYTGIEPREGLLPEVVLWLHEREIAVFSGDCIERLPSGYANVPLPLHQIGLSAMGLMILDSPDMELLAQACSDYERSDFVFVSSPLRLPGGSGSPVNPLVVF